MELTEAQLQALLADCDMWQRVACALAFKIANVAPAVIEEQRADGFCISASAEEVNASCNAFPGSHVVAMVHARSAGGFKIELREFHAAQKIIKEDIARRSQMHDMPPSVN